MNQAAFFGGTQCSSDLLCDTNCRARIEWPGATNAFLERFALDQFHRVKALPCLLTNSELENGSDVLVSKSGRGASLAQETFSGFATFGANAELNDLQRDLTLKRRI